MEIHILEVLLVLNFIILLSLGYISHKVLRMKRYYQTDIEKAKELITEALQSKISKPEEGGITNES